MNFVKHQKTLQKLLTTEGGAGLAGCYCYSRDEHDKTVKLGMSEAGLFKRIRSAKACYPYTSEFWLRYLIISVGGYYEAGKKSTTRHIETELLTQSKKSSTVDMAAADIAGNTAGEEGRRPKEYRIISSELNLEKLLQTTLNLHQDKWDYLICFSAEGWKIIPNNRGVQKPITSVKQLQYKGKGRKLISDLLLTTGWVVFPKYLKVGTVVRQGYWRPFTVLKIVSQKHIVVRFEGEEGEFDVKIK